MYTTFRAGLLILFALAPANAQRMSEITDSEAHEITNSYCLENVRFPSYPPLARQARLQGTLVVTVSLGRDATVETVSAEAHLNNDRAKSVLLTPIEIVLKKSSQFRRDCGGKQVVLVYEFRLTGDPYDGQQQEIAFGYPNRFWITSRPWPLSNSQQ